MLIFFSSYDALKKLFPSNPLDPTYLSTQQESSSLLPISGSRSDKYASPEEFRAALDREKDKVAAFYKGKNQDLRDEFRKIEEEIRALEDRELGGDDVIKEEPEDESDEEQDEGEHLLERSTQLHSSPNRPLTKKRESILNRLGTGWKSRRRSLLPSSTHEADIMEASVPNLRTQRSSSIGGERRLSQSADETALAPTSSSDGPPSPARSKQALRKVRRRSSEFSSLDDVGHERRTSMSSTSSHERELSLPRRRWQSLGLVEVDEADIPDGIRISAPNGHVEDGMDGEDETERPIYMWTGANDHATVMRIGFKKRISANWLEAYALKQYVDLNLTAFEKILKK